MIIKNIIKSISIYKLVVKNEKVNKSYKKNNSNVNMLIITKKITADDSGRMIIDFANNMIDNKINVTILSRFIKNRIFLNEKVDVFEKKFFLTYYYELFNLLFKKKHYTINVIGVYEENLLGLIRFIKKYIVKIKTVYFAFSFPKINNRVYFNFFKKNIEDVNFIFSISNNVSTFLLEKFSINADNIEQFNYYINNDIFDVNNVSHERAKKIMNNIGCNIFKKILFCSCNYENIDIILRAIKQIKRDDFICVFDIQKEINFYKKIMKIVEKYDISNCVKFVDKITDKSAILSLSYAVLCVQQDNDYSYIKTIREATTIGKPLIIISKNNSLQDVIDCKTGMFVDIESMERICFMIKKILDLPEGEYKKMQQNSISYSKKFFIYKNNCDYKNVAKNITKLIYNIDNN